MSDTFAPPPPSPEPLAAHDPAGADAHAPGAPDRGAGGPAPLSPAASARAPRRAGTLLLAAAVLVCGAGGAVGGKTLFAKAPPPEVVAAHDGDEAPAAAPAVPPPAAWDLAFAARVDLLIRSGSYRDALQMCRDAAPQTSGDEQPTAYREGLCLEGLGKPKEADAAFQKAEKDPNVGAWARALLGRARCAIADGSLPAARSLLDRVLLRSGHPECRGGRVYEEAVYLRAHAAVLEAGAPPPLDPLDAEALAWPSLRADPDTYLDWLPTDGPAASPNPDAGRDVVEMHAETDPNNPAVTVRLAKRPALDVLRALAAARELELHADASASALLADAVGPVEVDRLPLADLLSALTERVGVAWAVRGGDLHLSRAPRAAEPNAAAQALRTALAVAPEHPAAGSVRVALANLDARAGRVRAATLNYKQVLESDGNAPAVMHAAYNLGLMELKAGNRNGARARFLEVIDRGPNTRFADIGWCWIGRTYLDGGDPGAARGAYRTALDGRTKEAASAGALGICLCDLLTDNGDAARALLADARFSTRDAHALLATFYEALLRYRAAPTESRGERLLQALAGADECRGLGPAGVYLAGRVYAELALPQRTTALYEKEVETARGPLALRMLFDTAQRFDHLDQRKAARTRYLSLAAVDPDGLGGLAELKLAALDARDGNGSEAVRRCRALVSRPNVPREELLAVMGHGYELQKMYGAAAACFAGHLPK